MLNALDWFYWHSFWAQCLYRTIAWLATQMLQGRFHSPTVILFIIWPIYNIRKVHNYVTLKPTRGFLFSHSNSWLYWLTFTGIKTAPLQIYNDLPPLIYNALKGWVGIDRSACWVIIAAQEHPPLIQWEVCACGSNRFWMMDAPLSTGENHRRYCSKPTPGVKKVT